MTRRIRVLADEVANQIAAGEVVERPASVVKELVENALDARATSIEIQVDQGGKRRIRVSDDGVGMSREDAILCFDRHATSKIVDADDLRGVRSLGFRGEALPSIGAVARITLETREAGQEVGTRIRLNGGKMTGVDDCARRRGTTVEVEKLFFNAPARSKFLKSVRAETRAISGAVTTLALAHPGVGFDLRSGTRELLALPAASSVAGRVADLWGRAEASTLIPVENVEGRVTVRGLVQRPDAASPGTRRAYLFVNGRPFREPALVEAVDRGYRTTIPSDARPWLFLYLDVSPDAVDVNVHPTKAEVRFRDRAAVDAVVARALRDALGREESAATFDRERGTAPPASRSRGAVREGPPMRDQQTALFFSRDAPPERDTETTSDERSAGGLEVEEGRDIPIGRPRLWQLLDTYVLAETRAGLLIIDQHSAHERILFERLMDAFGAGGQEGQRLLFPLTLRLTPPEVEQVLELESLFARAGFEVEGFGGDSVIVHSVPNPHPWFDAERCFREMVDELTHGSELVRSARNQHERIAMTFACKGAVKAGQKLGAEEMHELFDALFATELPHHDVHGRPTIVRLSGDELERKFGRH